MYNIAPAAISVSRVNDRKPAAASRTRIESIDLLRGTVMIIMALDHVRAYFHRDVSLFDPTDLSKTTPLLFFTRWITHFCAPVFVFLAGVSAYVYGARKGRKALAFFLLTRGVWLLFAELFIVGLAWYFNPLYPYFNLQVIWAIGCSMIALAALIYLPFQLIGLTGVLIIAGHNLLDNVHVPGNSLAAIGWGLLHDGGNFHLGNKQVFIHYPILPWIGIMTVGFCAGYLYRSGMRMGNRRSILICLGAGAITLFIVLRALNAYGDSHPWSVQRNFAFSLASFLNTTKYPPSLLYTLMTLGPATLFLALSERVRTTWTSKIQVFGRVPMFYYLAHLYLVHLLAVLGAAISIHNWKAMFFLASSPARVTALKGYGFDLLVVYLVWIAVVLLLYPLCKRFDSYKRAHVATQWWLTYL